MIQGEYTRENGKKIRGQEMVMKFIKMETILKVIFKIISRMAKESIFGQVEKYTMVSGKTDRSMALVFGKVQMVILMQANGEQIKLMAMEFTFGKTATSLKESGQEA